MDLGEIIEKWDRLGFLYGLSEELKGNTAMTYERATNILVIDGPVWGSGNFLITAIFPVIYKICKTGLIIKNVPDLIQNFDQFITDNRQVIDDMYGMDFDVEAEMCRIFSEDYMEWLIDNPQNLEPNKFLPKHNL
jgi:hypothetical protein